MIYSETLNNEYTGRIYQMSSWQFFNEFYTISRQFQYLWKSINSHEYAGTVLKSNHLIKKTKYLQHSIIRK